ncbi:hypothetical protein D1872_320510 [compost metagenome]
MQSSGQSLDQLRLSVAFDSGDAHNLSGTNMKANIRQQSLPFMINSSKSLYR